MLELRPSCEHCAALLPPDSAEAWICSFECTFCTRCVSGVLENVCPNCGGGFERRPVRPKDALARHPASGQRVEKRVDLERFGPLRERNRTIVPRER